MSLPALLQGSLFAGRYQIVRCIAQGGMGAVYEVIHTETERARALKVMLPELVQNEAMRSRFRLEARVTARIKSEHIVDVLDAGIDDATGVPFLVMELLEGEELEKRLARLKRFEPSEVVTFLYQAALALDKTHNASIVHRDLKPANLMLTVREDGAPRIKLLDFGIAKFVAEGATGALATQAIGTPVYMAPEQIKLGEKVTPAVDVFALGMIAYTLLVGSPYWGEELRMASNMYALIAALMHGPKEPASARALSHGVVLSPEFDAWFAKMTAFDPGSRYATASSAIEALGEVFDGVALLRTSIAPAADAHRALAGSTSQPVVTPLATVPFPEGDRPSGSAAPIPGLLTSSDFATVPLQRSTFEPRPAEQGGIVAIPPADSGSSTEHRTTGQRPRSKDATTRKRAIWIGLGVICVCVVSVGVALRGAGPAKPAPGAIAPETSQEARMIAPTSESQNVDSRQSPGAETVNSIPQSGATADVAPSGFASAPAAMVSSSSRPAFGESVATSRPLLKTSASPVSKAPATLGSRSLPAAPTATNHGLQHD